jgi:hypothetical protein
VNARGHGATSNYALPSAHLASICQKPDPSEGLAWRWVSQPALRCDGSVGERSGEGCFVFGNASTRCSAVGEDQDSADAPCHPSALPSDLSSETRLSIKHDQRRLQVGHHRLDLDDKDPLGRLVVCEQVNRAALPPDVEGDLYRNVPAKRAKLDRGRLDESRVIRIEQAVETLALPCDEQLRARGQRADNRVDMAHRYVVGPTSLHPPHHRARNSRSTSQVGLPPSPSPP